MTPTKHVVRVTAAFAASLLPVLILGLRLRVATVSAQSTDEATSVHAFAAVATVLTSPRCLNCHVSGDSPLQGDSATLHNMNVKRGPDGRGTVAMRCTNCHQEKNSLQPHGPPGAPDWRLPPPPARMAWQGLSVAGVCQSLKDPAKNGGRDLSKLVEHVRDDHIVNWAWNPGSGRTRPPISHEEFVEQFTAWVQTGAACPSE